MKYILFLILLFPVVAAGHEGSVSEFDYQCLDKVERPYIVFIPKSTDVESSRPFLVYLHGAISNPQL